MQYGLKLVWEQPLLELAFMVTLEVHKEPVIKMVPMVFGAISPIPAPLSIVLPKTSMQIYLLKQRLECIKEPVIMDIMVPLPVIVPNIFQLVYGFLLLILVKVQNRFFHLFSNLSLWILIILLFYFSNSCFDSFSFRTLLCHNSMDTFDSQYLFRFECDQRNSDFLFNINLTPKKYNV